MSALSVRRYQPGDEQRVKELHEAAMRDVDAYVEGVPDNDLDDVEGVYLDGCGEFLVGTLDGRIVAMGAIRPVGERVAAVFESLARPAAELTRMRVDPGHQRRGFGERIYDELEGRARERGYRELVLDTQAHQAGARQFYEAKGFEEERRVEVEAFGETLDTVFCRKPLDG